MSILKPVLYKCRKSQNGTFPLKLRLYFGKERYIPLKISALPSEWNSKKGIFRKNADNYEVKNAMLRKRLQDADKILNEMLASNKPFSYDKFKQQFLGKTKVHNVFTFISELIDEMHTKGEIGNLQKYKQLINMLKKVTKGKNLAFIDVNYNFLVKLETFILARGVKKSTVHFYMRTLRATINEGIRRGYLNQEHYPFVTQFKKGGYSFSHLKGEYNPKPISADAIKLIQGLDTAQHSHLSVSLDLFSFMLKARGINFIDICYLTKENVQGNRLVYNRVKTGKRYSILITKEMKKIIEKYMDENYLFPILTNAPTKKSPRYHFIRKALKIFNDQLKEIAGLVGIDKAVSSYTARYTYTDILIRNNTPVQVVKQALGHSSIETTQHYIKSHSDEEVDRYDKLLGL